MNDSPKLPPNLPKFLWELFQQLRRRGFSIGIDDFKELQKSLRAGFGLSSDEALKDLCISLWAKSLAEQEILNSLFEQLIDEKDKWQVLSNSAQKYADNTQTFFGNKIITWLKKYFDDKWMLLFPHKEKNEPISTTEICHSLPEINLEELNVKRAKRKFIFVPQFPLNYREVAQTWRRLRDAVEVGALTELDVEETIKRRTQMGIPIPVILKARYRNKARLLLLVDRQGSMTPSHRFCELVCKAIQQAGRLEETTIYYFHNVPAQGANESILPDEFFPKLDSILPDIKPLSTGYIYQDSDLLTPHLLKEVLEKYAKDAFVVIISDAGAINKIYNPPRLLDTISFFKALRAYTSSYVWLNPLPKSYWENKNDDKNKIKNNNNTATQIARHIPMFPLDKEGILKAVNVLRGKKYNLEKPL
ncbi:MAG: hypothetical protein AAF915_29775 [Cyanobacteria bacterium P01_D01_bin.50]